MLRMTSRQFSSESLVSGISAMAANARSSAATRDRIGSGGDHRVLAREPLRTDDAEAVAAAREAWRGVKARGLEATYWRQNEAGRWEKQA